MVGGLVVAKVRDKGRGYGEGKSGRDPGLWGVWKQGVISGLAEGPQQPSRSLAASKLALP